MENIDLKLFLERYNGDVIYKICSCDELHFSLNLNEFVIVNTEPSYLPGAHWVAFYKNKSQTIEFFDSFGMLPKYYTDNFVKFICKNSCKSFFLYNDNQIQSNYSNICGLYCLLFYVSVSRNEPFYKFLNKFQCNKSLNDIYCLYSVEDIFNFTFSYIE